MPKDLLGKYVKFFVSGRKLHIGRVTSIEKGICNIKGIEQKLRSRPDYHIDEQEVRELTHDEVFMLGRAKGSSIFRS